MILRGNAISDVDMVRTRTAQLGMTNGVAGGAFRFEPSEAKPVIR